MGARQRERMLLRLIHRARRIVDERSVALFDMTSEDVRHRPLLGEFDHTSRARLVRRKIGDVQSTRIQMIAGEQHAGLAIVIRDVRWLVPRNREYIDYAIA